MKNEFGCIFKSILMLIVSDEYSVEFHSHSRVARVEKYAYIFFSNICLPYDTKIDTLSEALSEKFFLSTKLMTIQPLLF